MAAPGLSHNLTRAEDWEGSPPGTFGNTGLGGGPSAGAEGGLHYEAAQAASRRIAGINSERGFTYIDTATQDMTVLGSGIVIGKIFTALSAVINPNGSRLGYGQDVSNYFNYQVGDDGTMADGQFAIPPAGGYVIMPIEVRKTAWHNLARVGSPDLTIVDMYRMSHDVSATTGAGTSQALDSVDFTGDGLNLAGGDGVDTDAKFKDFVDADEGQLLPGAGRAGLWTSKGSTFFAYLNNVVGRGADGVPSGTSFVDEFFSVTFPGGMVGPDKNGLEFDLSHAQTTITLDNGIVTGEGRSRKKVWFDTFLGINETNDDIAVSGHGLVQGDQVGYSAEGNAGDIGPDDSTGEEDNATSAGVATTGDNWYVMVVDDDHIQLTNTAQDAYGTATFEQALTQAGLSIGPGSGYLHSLTRKPDTRPNINFIGTSGSATLTSVTLNACKDVNMTSQVTLDSCQVVASQSLNLASGTLDTCTINGPTVTWAESFLTAKHANELSDIDNSRFISGGRGHAIEITTSGVGSAPQVANLNSVDFEGYFTGDEASDGGWSFNASTDVASNQITITGHNFVTGDAIIYSNEGGTTIFNLIDQELYFLRSIDANTVELYSTEQGSHENSAPIPLSVGPNETQKLYSADAAIFNNTGTSVTINNLAGGAGITVRNGVGATTSVVNAVTFTLTGLQSNSEVRIYDDVGGKPTTERDGTESSSTTFAHVYNHGGSDIPVIIVIFHLSFRDIRLFLDLTATDQTLPITQVTDRVYDNP